jgi:hypothetical protein
VAFGDLRGFESEQTVGVRGRFVNLDANSYEGSQAFPRRLLPETLKPRLVYRYSGRTQCSEPAPQRCCRWVRRSESR